MIIKSMSRKEPSFDQLTTYALAPKGSQIAIRHNLPVSAESPEKIIGAFTENHASLPKRANGNALYHEIISLEPNIEISKKGQIAALQTIAERYLERRAPLQLALGVIHVDTAHIHMHLIVSSNAIFSRRRVWLKKMDFAIIQSDLEAFQLTHFPELGAAQHYDSASKGLKRNNSEQMASLRSKQPGHKEKLALELQSILQDSRSRDALDKSLSNLDLTLYQRGRSIGVKTSGERRYRLSTLGLAEDYTEAVTRFELYESRMTELDKSQSQRSKELEQER